MIQFDDHIFQMGWFNRQLENYISDTFLSITMKYDQIQQDQPRSTGSGLYIP